MSFAVGTVASASRQARHGSDERRRRSASAARIRDGPSQPPLHSTLRIMSGGRPGASRRDPRADARCRRSPAPCPVATPGLAVSTKFAAIELVDDGMAVALEDGFRRHQHNVQERPRWRSAQQRSCPAGSSDRISSRTRPRSKFRAGGQPDEKSTFASTEMRSMRGLELRPGIASMRILASCPTRRRPRSASSSRASRWTDDRSGSSIMAAPGHARSPSRNSTCWPPHGPLAR